jgi:hypothetical protein
MRMRRRSATSDALALIAWGGLIIAAGVPGSGWLKLENGRLRSTLNPSKS